MSPMVRVLAAVILAIGLEPIRATPERSRLVSLDHEASPLRIFLVPRVDQSLGIELRYSIVNTGDEVLAIRRHGLPFRQTLSGTTHLVVLRDGVEVVPTGSREIEAGVPMLDQLDGIPIQPGEAYSDCVPLDKVIGGRPTEGEYCLGGVWRVTVVKDAHPKTMHVEIPLTCLTVKQGAK